MLRDGNGNLNAENIAALKRPPTEQRAELSKTLHERADEVKTSIGTQSNTQEMEQGKSAENQSIPDETTLGMLVNFVKSIMDCFNNPTESEKEKSTSATKAAAV